MPRPGHFTPGKETPYPLYRKLDKPQGPVWTDAENVVPTGFRSPDRPASSELEYRRYPGLSFSVSNIYIDIKSLHIASKRNL